MAGRKRTSPGAAPGRSKSTDLNGSAKSPVEEFPARTKSNVEETSLRSPKEAPTPAMARAFNNGFSVVGIGASAGGLEALDEFFDNTPLEIGMAFVVVTH